MHNFIVTDVETGGLNAQLHATTEIGLIVLDGETLREVERYSTLVQPYDNLGYEKVALNITGITMDMINGGKPVHTVVNELSGIYSKYTNGKGRFKRKPIFVGHNVDTFDRMFIERLFQAGKKDLYENVDAWMYDTMIMARIKWGFKEKGFKLGECCERIGKSIIDSHRAMSDIEGNVELFKYFMQTPINGEGNFVMGEEKKKVRFREKFRF